MTNRTLALSLWVGASLLIAGCSGNSSAVPCTTDLLVDLRVATHADDPDLVINEVFWTITGNGMDPMMGAINTSAPGATASAEVLGLAPGDYAIDLEATSEEAQATCRGSATFSVTAGVAAEVGVLLRCKLGERLGGVRVNGKLNICAELTKAVVAPLQTSIGHVIAVRAQAEDAEGDPIEYAWTADRGTFASPSAAATSYRCEETGDRELTITVSDDGFGYCMDDWTVDIRCVGDDGAGGTGGAGATGGAGGVGGGGGGATGGAGGAGGAGAAGGGGGAGGAGGAGATGGHGGLGGAGGVGGSGATGGSGGVGGGAGEGGHGGVGGASGVGGSGAAGGMAGASGAGGADGGTCEVTVALKGP